MSDIDVSGVRTLSELLDQLPTGKAAAVLASRLGVWSEGLHKKVEESRFTYPKNFSRMGDDEISAASSYWIRSSTGWRTCGYARRTKNHAHPQLEASRGRGPVPYS